MTESPRQLSNLDASFQINASELKKSAMRIEEHFKDIQPDFLVFTGKSSLISRAICRQSEVMKSSSWVWFDHSLNHALTMLGGDDYDERADKILKQNYPQLTPGSNVMIIDEFSETGLKANYYVRTLNRLGFQKVNFAVFTASSHHRYIPSFFAGSYDEELRVLMKNVSGTVSNAVSDHAITRAKPVLRKINAVLSGRL